MAVANIAASLPFQAISMASCCTGLFYVFWCPFLEICGNLMRFHSLPMATTRLSHLLASRGRPGVLASGTSNLACKARPR